MFGNGNCCWILILILLFSSCGNEGGCGSVAGCNTNGCGNNGCNNCCNPCGC